MRRNTASPSARTFIPAACVAVAAASGLAIGLLAGESGNAEPEFDKELRVAYTVNNLGYTDTCG